MINVYESETANKRNSFLVVSGFLIFIFISAYLISRGIAYYYGYLSSGFEFTGIALVFSGLTGFASYFYSDKIILALSHARLADRKHDFLFFSVVENLSLASGLPMPALYVIEDSAMNAFATGRDPAHAVVCVTSGLVSRLNRTELEGVIAHEMSHIRNYDIRLMSLVTVMVGSLTLLGDWLFRASWFSGSGDRDEKDRGAGSIALVVGILFALVSPLIAQLIQLAISRQREYYADAAAVKLTRQPGGLISALKKLGMDKEPLEAANKATAHLYIVNPLLNRHDSVGWFSNLFATHPPLNERIARLENMS